MVIKIGKTVKKVSYHKILNKMVSERIIFTVCRSKRGVIFQLRVHSIVVVFQRCRTHMLKKRLSARLRRLPKGEM